MGLSLQGVCYKDGPEVARQFATLFPHTDSQGMSSLTVAPSVVGSTLNYSVLMDDYAGNTSRTNAGSIQLSTCDYNDITLGADYGFPLLIGCVILFGLGFIGTR